MDAQCDIHGQCPRSRRPRHKAHTLLIFQWKADHQCRITHILVVQPRLKVTQRSTTRSTKRHDLVPLIHQILLEQFLKHPPHTLHKRRIHRLIIILKINPTSQPRNSAFPLLRVSHDNTTTRLIVLIHAHFEDLIAMGNIELLIDFVFDGKAVAIPSGAAGDVMAGLAGVAGYDIFDCAGEDVSEVGEAGCEGWSVVEGEFLIASIQAQRILLLERVLLGPIGADFFLRFSKVECWWEVRHGA
mmetsp:Transcript_9074/g.20500  ORF Transcript_9074/g.20500 Transcript_9074/m.20500 type:complete len:243 (+) Transcript_9074:3037-3765(+)